MDIGYDNGYLGIPFEEDLLSTRTELKTSLFSIEYKMNFKLPEPKLKKPEEPYIIIKEKPIKSWESIFN